MRLTSLNDESVAIAAADDRCVASIRRRIERSAWSPVLDHGPTRPGSKKSRHYAEQRLARPPNPAFFLGFSRFGEHRLAPLFDRNLPEQEDENALWSEHPEKSPEEVGRFIGQDALQKIHAEGPKRKLVGLNLDSRRAARQDMKVKLGDEEIGFVTSGCLSPTLGKSIAMAYVTAEHAEAGKTVQVDLGRQSIDAEIAPLPFYKSGS